MTYVDAILDRTSNEIKIVERINGQRVFNVFPSEYTFYYTDDKGKFRTIFGDPVQKFTTNYYKIFVREQKLLAGRKIFEADINPIFKCLEKNYHDSPEPDLHVGFFDIEVAFDPEKGYATPDDAFSPITAISIYLNWLDLLITVACKPETITTEEAQKICGHFPNCYLCDSEKEMLELFLKFIDDVDILTGWNSGGFDIPYIYNRIIQVLGKDYTRMLCLWDEYPKKKTYTQFKADKVSYELVGRVHLDYLDLYRKHNTSERASHALDFIAQQEIGERKTPYEGSLDKLYKDDFQRFIEYNRQDVMLIVKIDKLKKYISLSNQIAHLNSVLLKNTMGSVAWIDQAIINEAHRRSMVVPNRRHSYDDSEHEEDGDDENEETAAGAYVADPKVGLHEWIGGVDVSSLYPSTIRAFNMSPETVVGQIKQTYTQTFIEDRLSKMRLPSHTKAWEGVFNVLEYDIIMAKEDKELVLELESGERLQTNGRDLYDFIFNSTQYCISANGTIFRQDIDGLLPGLLSRWYSNRKSMQKKAKDFYDQYEQETDPIKKAELLDQHVFWDQRQYIQKIALNSLYGAILNPGSRFFDHRIGQSVTLSGRAVDRHMGAFINELITGKYDHVGDAIIYADTDSSLFSSYAFDQKARTLNGEDLKKYFIKRYNDIGKKVNESFPEFLNQSFHVPLEKGKVIGATRDLVGTRGLFITKKRYSILVYDKEGKRKDLNPNGGPIFDEKTGKQIFGELKSMGLDTKRTDTPKPVQDFLEEIIMLVLTGKPEGDVIAFIKEYREKFRKMMPWEKGTPKKVNALTYYTSVYQSQEDGTVSKLQKKHDNDRKITIPGHVRAAISWNRFRKIFNDNYSPPLIDGSKVIVCRLKANNLGIATIALPVEIVHIPEWFRTLPFDDDEMEKTILDKKIHNLIGVLGWDLGSSKQETTFSDLFHF